MHRFIFFLTIQTKQISGQYTVKIKSNRAVICFCCIHVFLLLFEVCIPFHVGHTKLYILPGGTWSGASWKATSFCSSVWLKVSKRKHLFSGLSTLYNINECTQTSKSWTKQCNHANCMVILLQIYRKNYKSVNIKNTNVYTVFKIFNVIFWFGFFFWSAAG